MAKEIIYRRSFHSDRDLVGILPFDLDQSFTGRQQLIPDRKTIDGLEAPRNSLDIPSAEVDIRRLSHYREENIPVGYELTRSLTTRKKTEESQAKLNLSFSQANGVPEQRRRTTNVVARLMGLEAMPDVTDRTQNSKSISAEKRSLQYSTSQRKQEDLQLPQDGRPAPHKQDRLSSVQSLRDMPVQEWYEDFQIDRKPREVLSFREHPQEKQLQEFKREFAARQASQPEELCPKEPNVKPASNHHTQQLHEKVDETEQVSSGENSMSTKWYAAPEKRGDSREFLDALDFLHANKKLFLEVLKDPKSLFSRRLQQIHRGKPLSHLKANRTAESYSEHGKETLSACSFPGSFVDSNNNMLELGRNELKLQGAKELPGWQQSMQKKFQPNETMPLHNRRQRRQTPADHDEKIGSNGNQVLERIVVLKPSLEKCSSATSAFLANPSRANGNLGMPRRGLGKENSKEKLGPDSRASKFQTGRTGKQVAKSSAHLDQGMKDSREIAHEIIKQAKENLSRKPSKEVSTTWDALMSKSRSTGRRLSTQRIGIHGGDTSGLSDGEVPQMSSSRASRTSATRLYSSLPNSPRLSTSEEDHGKISRVLSNEHKRISPRRKFSAQSSRDLFKCNLPTASDLQPVSDACSKLECRSSRLVARRNPGKDQSRTCTKTGSKSSSKQLVLPDSRVTVGKQNQQDNLERNSNSAGASSKPAAAGCSLFRDKASNVEDRSSAVTKKKSSHPVQGLEAKDTLPPKRHCNGSPSSSTASCTPTSMAASKSWRFVAIKDQVQPSSEQPPQHVISSIIVNPEESTPTCVAGKITESSLASIDLYQWASTTDALDSASETSTDKCEQPSPVSVLETPFQEPPTPVDSPEEDSIFHDFRLKLSRLKLDGTKPNYGDIMLDAQGAVSLEFATAHGRLGLQSKKNGSWQATGVGACQPLETFSVHDIPCPIGRESQLFYIRDILVSSGFTMQDVVLVTSFSTDHGLDPCVFRKLEQQYRQKYGSSVASMGAKERFSLPNAMDRRLLYEIVDEIFLERLAMSADHSWLRPTKASLHYMRNGKQLLKQIWSEITAHSFSECDSAEEALEDLVSRDISRAGWVHSRSEVENVGLELEAQIFNVLVDEAVLDFCNFVNI